MAIAKADRFLGIALQRKLISSHVLDLVLHEQEQRKGSGQTEKCGEILIRKNFLSPNERDDILRLQQEVRQGNYKRFHPIFAKNYDSSLVPLFLALASVLCIFFLQGYYGYELSDAIQIGTYLVFSLISLAFQYQIDKSLQVSAYRVVKAFSVVLILALPLYVFLYGPNKRILHATFFSLVVLIIHGWWKQRCVLFARHQLGAMQDMVVATETAIQRIKSITNPEYAEKMVQDVIEMILRKLLSVLRINPYDRVRTLGGWRKPAALTVWYANPLNEEIGFKLSHVVLSPEIPNGVERIIERVKNTHRPALLNEEKFREIIETAKRMSGTKDKKDSKSWTPLYFNDADRHKYISAIGWIHATQKPLFTQDASTCFALDDSFLEAVESDERGWVDIGSFFGVPIKNPIGMGCGVLMVLKNHKNGFLHEDPGAIQLAGYLIQRVIENGQEGK